MTEIARVELINSITISSAKKFVGVSSERNYYPIKSFTFVAAAVSVAAA